MARSIPADIAEQVVEEANQNIPKRVVKKIKEEDLAPSGSTLLNLACSDTPHGAYELGSIVTIPGASQSGKTILSLTSLAEASMLPRFDEYKLIHDDAEERRAFDLVYLFGKKVADRIEEPPLGNSPTIQKFQANALNLLKSKQPFIYILDSFDSLSSDEELEKEMRKALAMAKSDEAAKKIAGSYNTEKAKIAGQMLRMVNNDLKHSKSLIIIIQQRRQKIGAGPFEEKYTTSGGEAPFFYSQHQIWISKAESIKEQGQVIGNAASIKMKKNSLTGKLRDKITFDIYYDYGIDDINSCVDFLLETGYWKKNGNYIVAEDLDIKEMRTNLVIEIEKRSLERRLIKATHSAWKQREELLKLDRKPRYE